MQNRCKTTLRASQALSDSASLVLEIWACGPGTEIGTPAADRVQVTMTWALWQAPSPVLAYPSSQLSSVRAFALLHLLLAAECSIHSLRTATANWCHSLSQVWARTGHLEEERQLFPEGDSPPLPPHTKEEQGTAQLIQTGRLNFLALVTHSVG